MPHAYPYRSRSYLERYQRGKCEEVWLELTALGPIIRQEPLYQDARAVAQETVRRIRHNSTLLLERLRLLNYTFACEHRLPPTLPLQLTDASDYKLLDAVEQAYGLLPLSVRALYEQIAAIDFRGDHPTLSQYAHEAAQEDALRPVSDPLFIAPFDPMEGTVEGMEEPELAHLGTFASFWFMPDSTLKAQMSGGLPSYVIFPNAAMDTHFVTGDWPGMLIMSYLRLSFQWGGFAAFQNLPKAAAAAKKELAFLTQGLLPI
jgi:hypothetical protein